MNSVRSIQKLNKRELEEGITPEASWHTDYRDTAFIYIGGLPFELSEGDVITIFSQFGEPVWVKLARDKETGKSRGFGWLKYEDQRSTDLAVDNLGGVTVMGRVLRVDHTRYQPRDDEDMRDNTMGELESEENGDRRKRRRTATESESEEDRPLLKEELELEKLMRDLDDDDPMKPSMVREKQEEVDAALKRYEKAKRKDKKHHSRRHHRDRSDSRHRERDRRRIKDDGVDEDYSKSSRRKESPDDLESTRRGLEEDRHRRIKDRSRSRDRNDHRHRHSKSSSGSNEPSKRHGQLSSRRDRTPVDDGWRRRRERS
jgi:RNA-binding motif protein, X-linked 2